MKQFGHQRIIRDEQGQMVELRDSPVKAVTIEPAGFGFGQDSKRRLVVSLEKEDLICVRPQRTARTYTIEAKELFRYLCRLEANRLTLERARERKAKKAERLARARQERAEKRLFQRRDA